MVPIRDSIVEFLELPGASVSCPTLTHSNASLDSVPCNKGTPNKAGLRSIGSGPDERPTRQ
jgi:hypothetical protein